MDVDSVANHHNWLCDYGVVDAASLPVSVITDFPAPPTAGFSWSPQEAFANSSNVSMEVDCSFGDLDSSLQDAGPRKRFLELSSILDPGRPLKTDKTAILSDAIRMVTHLRTEAQQLKESNKELEEKIKELKAEKNELRDEKQRLKAEKEKLEQQVATISSPPGLLHPTPAISASFAAQGKVAGNKLMHFVGYPSVAMWQFMPPAVVDTSQDHVLRPPVA
ncbi:hypothetical protein Tsubulata_019968 [Turnera subulata]|uniref:BHLH domain-containing protein n=1 Tax=Turnera subulata TaxID=218843 RepID=A0A9Q0GJK9_9ROSI|nr:hypothetical protein Tsubulata_019968 [Turnera subulata]